jgi:hypothetical protein
MAAICTSTRHSSKYLEPKLAAIDERERMRVDRVAVLLLGAKIGMISQPNLVQVEQGNCDHEQRKCLCSQSLLVERLPNGNVK